VPSITRSNLQTDEETARRSGLILPSRLPDRHRFHWSDQGGKALFEELKETNGQSQEPELNTVLPALGVSEPVCIGEIRPTEEGAL
jgi:hypothetical protein